MQASESIQRRLISHAMRWALINRKKKILRCFDAGKIQRRRAGGCCCAGLRSCRWRCAGSCHQSRPLGAWRPGGLVMNVPMLRPNQSRPGLPGSLPYVPALWRQADLAHPTSADCTRGHDKALSSGAGRLDGARSQRAGNQAIGEAGRNAGVTRVINRTAQAWVVK